VAAKETVFLTDGRYDERSRNEVQEVERVISRDGLLAPLGVQCARLGVARLGFEAHDVSVQQHERIGAAMPAIELVPIGGEVERQRWVKDDEESELLRRAQAITDQAFDD